MHNLNSNIDANKSRFIADDLANSGFWTTVLNDRCVLVSHRSRRVKFNDVREALYSAGYDGCQFSLRFHFYNHKTAQIKVILL